MDFNAYLNRAPSSTQSDHKKAQHEMPMSQNFDHYTDPYMRRYFIAKAGFNSMKWALGAFTLKLLFENMRGYKFYKFSPWIELAVFFMTFSVGLKEKFRLKDQDSLKEKLMGEYQRQHYFNSQYWH